VLLLLPLPQESSVRVRPVASRCVGMRWHHSAHALLLLWQRPLDDLDGAAGSSRLPCCCLLLLLAG
jgi:hypothetical protein